MNEEGKYRLPGNTGMFFREEDTHKIETFTRGAGTKKSTITFTIKALFSDHSEEIETHVAMSCNGLPQQSFSPEALYIFRRRATIDYAVVEWPEDLESAQSIKDNSLLDDLYSAILKHSAAWQTALKKNTLPAGVTKPQVPG